ncbi:MAG: sulfatase-like hydrolase/transferase [Haloferula sp.]
MGGILPVAAGSEELPRRPNIILIVGDDVGYSDIGCFGSEIQTPHLDSLGMQGMRFTQFTNMSKCDPTRSALLTGLMTPTPMGQNKLPRSHPRAGNSIHFARLLKEAGYYTAMAGKEHYSTWVPKQMYASNDIFDDYFIYWAINPFFERGDGKDFENPFMFNGKPISVDEMIPHRKPFFKTDVVTDYALSFLERAHQQDKPFFLYLPYHAAHYPIQARPEDIARYRGHYQKLGWNRIRQARFEKQQGLGILPPNAALPPTPLNWEKLSEREQHHEDEMMAIFSGLITRMDENIGRIIEKTIALECADNTLIIFISDNGSTEVTSSMKLQARTPKPRGDAGGPSSYDFLGRGWATVGNTPYRQFKRSSFAGGQRTHGIFYWPGTIQPKICHAPTHLTDLYPTFLELAGITYPQTFHDIRTPTLDGLSLAPLIQGKALPAAEQRLIVSGTYETTQSLRMGNWKWITGDKVRGKNQNQYLFDLAKDPCESENLYKAMPEKVQHLEQAYEKWLSERE